jgi:para-nitrobenzyl esterase
MSHPALSEESDRGVSGNYGILDQVSALEWVQRNISQFGGDPDNVTIGGESAGALNSSVLLASPVAKNLFKRVVIQSGGFWPLRSLAQNEELGSKIMSHLGVGGTDDALATLNDMRSLGPEEVLLASNEVRGAAGYGPVVDGWVMPGQILQLYDRKKDNPAEVLVGVNAHEFSLFLPRRYAGNEGGMPTQDDYAQTLAYYAGNDDGVKKLKGILGNESNLFRKMERLSTAGFFLCRSNEAARRLANSGHDVFYYYFSRARAGQKQWIGAHHAAELPYIFNTGNHVLPSAEWDYTLTEAMADYWAGFIRTGNPNVKDLARWPLFEPASGRYLDIGDTLMVGDNLESELCSAIPTSQ